VTLAAVAVQFQQALDLLHANSMQLKQAALIVNYITAVLGHRKNS
jgi:hypothetical protein